MSASFAKADILQGGLHVRYVPKADIGSLVARRPRKKVIYSPGFEKIYASCLMLKLSKLSEAVASWEHCGAEGPRSRQFAVALPASLSLI